MTTPRRRSAQTLRAWALIAVTLVLAPALSGCDQAPAGGTASGAEIYQLCTQCHGPNGLGNHQANTPAIAGLPAWYIEAQLLKFRAGQRGAHPDDLTGMQMRPIARTLTNDVDVKTISDFVSKMPRFRQRRAGIIQVFKHPANVNRIDRAIREPRQIAVRVQVALLKVSRWQQSCGMIRHVAAKVFDIGRQQARESRCGTANIEHCGRLALFQEGRHPRESRVRTLVQRRLGLPLFLKTGMFLHSASSFTSQLANRAASQAPVYSSAGQYR